MKYVPLKNFLGKPLQLKTGNVYYEKELDEAIQKYEAQFQKVNELNKSDVIKSVCEHPHTIGSFFGGKRYIVKCKDCGEEL